MQQPRGSQGQAGLQSPGPSRCWVGLPWCVGCGDVTGLPRVSGLPWGGSASILERHPWVPTPPASAITDHVCGGLPVTPGPLSAWSAPHTLGRPGRPPPSVLSVGDAMHGHTLSYLTHSHTHTLSHAHLTRSHTHTHTRSPDVLTHTHSTHCHAHLARSHTHTLPHTVTHLTHSLTHTLSHAHMTCLGREQRPLQAPGLSLVAAAARC